MLEFAFIANSILLGIGLAMDAFSVSVANGLNDANMKKSGKIKIAGTFAFFQFIMPLIGWFLVTRIAEKFEKFQKFIPWIALFLLLFIGIDMIIESIKDSEEKKETKDDTKLQKGEHNLSSDEAKNKHEKSSDSAQKKEALTLGFMTLMLQGIATSIDALSVGFTISDYGFKPALLCSLIIAVVTFIICIIGLRIGIHFGTKLSKKAAILGGSILIFIGLEIFIKGLFF
ncbi:MAG: manganese efflux pump [Lachnospiraceae bacterium]|nr:manganese efflux pump [Lachnospiraceae bacterium]